MTVYLPSAPMPKRVHAQWVSVRESRGLHINYPNGFPNMERTVSHILEPIYHGVTWRVFFYSNSTKGYAKVQMYSDSNAHTSAELRDQVVTFVSKYHNVGETKNLGIKIGLGTYYSMGVRIVHGTYLQAVFDDRQSSKTDMKRLYEKYKFKMVLETSNQVVLSIHFSDEFHLTNWLPGKGLGQRYHYVGTRATPGSYYMAVCVFDGSSKDVEVEMFEAKTPTVAKFKNVSLKKNEEFTLLVRNTPSHWVLHLSFYPNTHIFSAPDWRNYTDMKILKGAYFKKIDIEILREVL
ncbi:uncharacterized protein LOC144103855 [Amblyomma americanum]